jgi:hypothetical protein
LPWRIPSCRRPDPAAPTGHERTQPLSVIGIVAVLAGLRRLQVVCIFTALSAYRDGFLIDVINFLFIVARFLLIFVRFFFISTRLLLIAIRRILILVRLVRAEFVVAQFLVVADAGDLFFGVPRFDVQATEIRCGDLQAVEKQSGAAAVEAAVKQGVQHLLQADLDGVAVFQHRQDDAGAGGASGRAADTFAVAAAVARLVVPVAQIGVAQGRALADFAVGQYVRTGSCRAHTLPPGYGSKFFVFMCLMRQ